MQRRRFLALTASAAALEQATRSNAQPVASGQPQEVLLGVWKFRFGEPERITPTSTRRYGEQSLETKVYLDDGNARPLLAEVTLAWESLARRERCGTPVPRQVQTTRLYGV